MAQKITLKRSAVPDKVPTTDDLDLGELAVNTADGKIYLKKDDGTPEIVEIGAGGWVGTAESDLDMNGYNFVNNVNSSYFDNSADGSFRYNRNVAQGGQNTVFRSYGADQVEFGFYSWDSVNGNFAINSAILHYDDETTENGLYMYTTCPEGVKIATSTSGRPSPLTLGAGNLVFPGSDGTNGQVMTTDGAGNLSFTDMSGGGGWVGTAESDLDMNGNTLIDNTRRLRIGEHQVGDNTAPDNSVSNRAYATEYSHNRYYAGPNGDGSYRVDTRIESYDDSVGYESGALYTSAGLLEIGPGILNGSCVTTLGTASLKWPNSDGTDGQVLTTDGAGNLSFADAGAGGWVGTAESDLDMAGFALTTANGNSIDIRPDSGGGGRITFYGDAYRFPDNDNGVAGRVLTTDGVGNLSFEEVSGGGGWSGEATSDLNMNDNIIRNGSGNIISLRSTGSQGIQINCDYDSATGGQGPLQFIGQDSAGVINGGNPWWMLEGFYDGKSVGLCNSLFTMVDRGDNNCYFGNIVGGSHIFEATASFTNELQLRGSNWPSDLGVSDQILVTDGAGQLRWDGAVSAFLADWVSADSPITDEVKVKILAKNTTTPPLNPEVGDQYYNATLNMPLWWSGTDWLDGRGRDPAV